MAEVTITLRDTAAGGIAIQSSYHPGVGEPCSRAQATALEIISRTRREWGLIHARAETREGPADGIKIDAVHFTREVQRNG